MAEIDFLDKVWTEFLTHWPVEKVRSMTLEQYHTVNDSSCFVRWLESKAKDLGAVRSGSYFKYGVFQRGNRDEDKESGQTYAYGDVYAWRSKLGTTPEQAFARVKEAILSIIASIQHGDLDGVQLVDNQRVLQSTITWKIAFLYQDRNNPQMVSVYAKESLIAALHDADASTLTQAELYRRIMERRAGKNLHVYSGEIWEMGRHAAAQSSQSSVTPASQTPVSLTNIPLNQILYGPPGTGKTYATVERALEIFVQAGLRNSGNTRQEQLRCFNNLVQDGHIRFVTFHQSFCYEDFVEGIRAVTDDDGKISYEVKDGIFKELCTEARGTAGEAVSLPYVLIIDEINRGNVSRIFGELITLLEDSHRASLDKDSYQRDTVTVRLPYSRDFFSVPENIYIIGTMNTADQSLTGLDVALRRRFAFTEMPPRPELLQSRRLEGTTVTLGDLLDCLNQRIAALLDKEHCLGHAYFMGLGDSVSVAELSDVFKKHIVPLLEEYFFADWEKIQWVLNDHRKALSCRFVIQEGTQMARLFGDNVRLPEHAVSWRWNPAALGDMNAYVQIVDAGITVENPDEYGMENLPGELVNAIDWEEYRIERYRSESQNYPIRITFQGEPVSNVTQTLKTIAGKLGIVLEGSNTQSQGAFLMRKLQEKK
ncbi:AAA family ATPase [uncultured Desulfovibrio sp.]|uniref:McrB family protein n=1 Tax=uncultured Desulfovibrio sp. TaxID=167968 RepID=UPI00260EEE04|nr:AAA family ATPase [uncultured Desulfovibrio sp.]